jgi:hypothetical protein
MGWSAVWPVSRWDTPDDDNVFGNIRAALAERDALTPTGFLPGAYSRLDAIEGVPPSTQAVGQLQKEVAELLVTGDPWRWWDRSRGQAYVLADLLTDALGQGDWSHDLLDAASRWTPPLPVVFNELRQAANQFKCLRRLAASGISSRTDSVYDLTFGITDWPAERAAALAQFDGVDDGVDTGLVYDVGLSGAVFDSGSDEQWYLDARQVTVTFDTSDLDGLTVSRAWIELTTEAPGGSADYSDTFTAEVTGAGDAVRGTFASDNYTLKSIELNTADINTSGTTELGIRSGRANTQDRAAWSPAGPDYTSTYREGFDLSDTLRLIVEVQFEYRA